MDLIGNFFKLLLIYFAGASHAAPQSWNCSTGTGFCILISEERRSWHDASDHCFQRRGGLAHSDHFEHCSSMFRATVLDEETNINVTTSYARRRVDPAKLCYFMNRNGIVTEGFCKQQLHYMCIMPALVPAKRSVGEEFPEVQMASGYYNFIAQEASQRNN
ncbi:hypothetical protein DAPPUDRAFT_257208 [Daphnia pulex]|uniref:C-type lectin domain-containing protein n=1 Tax=Daphnia pulex TaxID=6669 RepID=E9HD26_DAPPU|nr:hypothetical protein DAPPUDRAFT_257208 [Daphnia pulex]|eukprot:EFX70366.1 hypothetical protein DAPPUDRAFT_257208 [Daphnia pulex]